MEKKQSRQQQIILGVDPGTRITGFGIISSDGSRWQPLDFGCISPPPKLPLPKRYLLIHSGIEQLLDHYPIDALAIENQYVCKNAQSALKLGMAKGVIMLAATKRQIPVFEYAPKQAKRAVVGSGSAPKYQVQRMIQTLLGLSELPEPEDAADALALAICHSHHLDFAI
jgi:crossover junction endodeoxyribonuclease RuvC